MRTLTVFIALALVLYVSFSLMLYMLQDRLVFLPHMPGRALDATPDALHLAYEDVSIETADGEQLHGWFVPTLDRRATVLFFHGNAGNISHRLQSLLIFNQLGLDVLMVDYRGYGQSSGEPDEAGTYLDAQAAWDYLVDQRQVAAGEIVVFGRSLGGAVGAWLASQPDVEPAGVVIESSFSSGVDMGRRLYPVLPVRLITRIKYPVKEYVSRLDSPLLVIHSRDDEIIPFDMGRAIYEAATDPKSFFEMGGDHNAGFWISRERYVPALDEFLTNLFGPSRARGREFVEQL